MPKFEITTDIDIKKVLTSLGVTSIFSASSTGFGRMVSNVEMFVSQILHQAKIKVDEKGTEAAAVTVIMVGTTSFMPADEPVEIVLDRPFSYVIFDKNTNVILFSGAYSA